MALTTEERKSLQAFKDLKLDKTQVQIIIKRSLTDREWKAYNRDYKTIFNQVAKQAANVALKKFKVKNVKPSDEDIDLLRSEKYQSKIKPYLEDS